MNAEKTALGNSVKNAERQLFRLKKFLKEESGAEKALQELIAEFEKIRELISEDANKKRALEIIAREHALLPLFKEVSSELGKLEKGLRENEWKLAEIGELLEEFRDYREYKFPDSEKAAGFIAAALEHYAIEKAEFKIEIIGTPHFEEIEKKLSLGKKGAGFEIEASRIEELVKHLNRNGIKKGFQVNSSAFRTTWKDSSILLIKADRKVLKQLDSLSLSHEGKYSEC